MQKDNNKNLFFNYSAIEIFYNNAIYSGSNLVFFLFNITFENLIPNLGPINEETNILSLGKNFINIEQKFYIKLISNESNTDLIEIPQENITYLNSTKLLAVISKIIPVNNIKIYNLYYTINGIYYHQMKNSTHENITFLLYNQLTITNISPKQLSTSEEGIIFIHGTNFINNEYLSCKIGNNYINKCEYISEALYKCEIIPFIYLINSETLENNLTNVYKLKVSVSNNKQSWVYSNQKL